MAFAVDSTTVGRGPQSSSMIALEKLLWAARHEKKPEHRMLSRRSESKRAQGNPSFNVTPLVKRKRAPRTCTECHRRKVRCDVAYRGGPCHKCQFYERKCIPSVTGRKKALQERVKVAIEKAGLSSDINTPSPVSEAPPVSVKCDYIDHSSPIDSNISSTFSDQKARSDITDASQTSHSYDIGTGLLVCCPPEPPLSTANPEILPSLSGPPAPALNNTVPDIFEPFPKHMDATDIEYLKSRQALVLPSQTLQKHLLQTYARFVHRNLPVFDLQPFFSTIDFEQSTWLGPDKEKSDRIPLLLFQAVMFVAAGYADLEILKSSGYASRRAAQERFYKRARTLYDLNTCSDRLSTVQAVLLLALGSMTCTLEPSGGRDSWYWLGIATSLCYTLALNREEPPGSTSRRDRQLRRRTWWMIVVLDRLLCLFPSHDNTVRTHRISYQDCNVKMLTSDDFNLQPPCFDRNDEFNEVRMGEDAFNLIDSAMICWYGHKLALYRYPSALQAGEDVRMSTLLKDAAVEEDHLTRVASYTLPMSEETEGIVILSAVIQ